MRKSLTTEEFVHRSIVVHGHTYDYSKSTYTSCKDRIDIVCKVHGIFSPLPLNHITKKSGCPRCSVGVRPQNQPLSLEDFIRKAKEVHGDYYDYSQVNYKNTHTKVKIGCPVHGVYLQAPVKHTSNRCGCPSCKKPSRGEEAIREFLEKHDIAFSREHTFNTCRNPNTGRLLKFDFYVPSKNLIIEFDGEHHYKPTRYNGMSMTQAVATLAQTLHCDEVKNTFLKQEKISLLRIPYMLSSTKLTEHLTDHLS